MTTNSNLVSVTNNSPVILDPSDVDETDEEISQGDANPNPFKRKRILKKTGSDAWKYFKIEANNGVTKYFCTCNTGKKKNCNKEYESSTGLTSLKYHLEHDHGIIFHQKKGIKRIKTDVDQILVDWIVDDQQAFQVVENSRFKKLVECLDPTYKIPCRQKIATMVHSKYEKISSSKLEYLNKHESNVFKINDIFLTQI